ncbi:MAG: hypothetical protein F6J93_25075 [Oscillatoria sp. SIO1A7]|nr:hypothetical protein [Oscillatoria sp. SIO1A7]
MAQSSAMLGVASERFAPRRREQRNSPEVKFKIECSFILIIYEAALNNRLFVILNSRLGMLSVFYTYSGQQSAVSGQLMRYVSLMRQRDMNAQIGEAIAPTNSLS